jgi:alpha-ketoglutarate-dependent taurine dioxygenase
MHIAQIYQRYQVVETQPDSMHEILKVCSHYNSNFIMIRAASIEHQGEIVSFLFIAININLKRYYKHKLQTGIKSF